VGVEVGAAEGEGEGEVGEVGEAGAVDELELFVSIIGFISGSFDIYDSKPEPVSFETNIGEDTGDVST
jgi:hypothetical protein